MVNSILQGRNENILTFTDKIHLWRIKVSKCDIDMFSNAVATMNKVVIPLVSKYLNTLQDKNATLFSEFNN